MSFNFIAAIAICSDSEAQKNRSGAAAERSNPMSKERWLLGCRRAERSHSTLKVRRGGGEEIPLIQGKEQQLRFAEQP